MTISTLLQLKHELLKAKDRVALLDMEVANFGKNDISLAEMRLRWHQERVSYALLGISEDGKEYFLGYADVVND